MTDDRDDDLDAEHWHAIAETCFSKRRLYPSEREFTERMVALTLKGLRPSAAQARWLMRIHSRREIDGAENSDL
jgi:hypothetical protein